MSEMRNTSSHAKAINEGIKALTYRPEEVLAFHGETISNFVSKQGVMEEDQFIVTTKTKHTISSKYDIAVPNARKDITYPGALLLGNENLVNGVPDPLVLHRRPMTISIDLPGLTQDNRIEIERNDYAGVSEGMNTLLNHWLQHEAKQFTISANMSYKKSILYDKKSMALTFGCDVEYLQNRLGIDFQSITKQEGSAYLIQFKQIYYTVSAQLPQLPADVFADDVTWEDVQSKINNDNPPCYVQNVQYGREVYVLLQSSLSSSQLKAHVEGNLSFTQTNISTKDDVDTKNMNKNIDCTIITMGGKPIIVNGNLENDHIIEKVNDIISENVLFSAKNPAFPLSYTVAFLKDNKIATIQGSSEYITSESKIFHKGALYVSHQGAYVARFYITWDEISYDDVGEKHSVRKEWSENGRYLTAGFSTMISLPANATNIHVIAQGATGLVWDPWTTSLDETYTLLEKRSITLSGTTLHQSVEVIPNT